MPLFQHCRSAGQNRYDMAAYISETIGGDYVRRFVCG